MGKYIRNLEISLLSDPRIEEMILLVTLLKVAYFNMPNLNSLKLYLSNSYSTLPPSNVHFQLHKLYIYPQRHSETPEQIIVFLDGQHHLLGLETSQSEFLPLSCNALQSLHEVVCSPDVLQTLALGRSMTNLAFNRRMGK